MEIAWLAGLLEGEGTFFLTRSIVNGKLYHYPFIALNMTDKDVVAKASGMFGTKVSQPGYGRRQDGTRGLPYYRITISGERAVSLMAAILPFMGERRTGKIQEILAAHAARPSNPGTRKEACRNSPAAKAYHDHRKNWFPPNWPTNEKLKISLETKTQKEVAAELGMSPKRFDWFLDKAEKRSGIRLRRPRN